MNVSVDPQIFFTYKAKDIQTKLSDNPTCIEVTDTAAQARLKLNKFDFDQAPVTSDGVVIGWLRTADLSDDAKINQIFKNLSQRDLISAEAPLNEALFRLTSQELIFLVGSNGIEGFIVRSDISRHVSRAHLYLLISGLEIVMARIVARDLNDHDILMSLMKNSSKEAWEKDKRLGYDANPIEYLDLRGLGDAIARIKDAMNHMAISIADWKKFVLTLTDIRNWVAHSNTEQITKHPFFDIVDKMRLTEKCIKSLLKY